MTIHRVIYEELVRGIINPQSKSEYLAIIDRLLAKGALGIISGCTEIELLIHPEDLRVPMFPPHISTPSRQWTLLWPNRNVTGPPFVSALPRRLRTSAERLDSYRRFTRARLKESVAQTQ